MGLVVRQHTRTDTPYGLFLSGGVDSAVTLAMLREQNGGRLQTYSVGFPGSGVYDELDDARRMAERFGTEHTQVEVPEAELLREIPNVAAAVGDLMGDYASLPTMLLARRAARDVKVIFSGEGGDEVFAGYGRYRPHAVKRLRQRLAARASRKVEPLEGGIEFLRPEVAARWREATRQAPTPWGLVSEIAPGMLGRQLVDFRTRLPSFLLAKVDRVLMHHGIEGRVPFLDHRIVEFGLALPDSLKVRWRAGKYLLKKWAERRLPREALWREKQGFRVPIERILSAPVRAALAERLHGQHVLGELLDLERLDPVLATRQLPGDYALVVWRLLVLSAWHDSVMVMGSSARSG